MVNKTIEIQAMDIEDVTGAVSKILGRDVEIGDIEISVVDSLPMEALYDGNISRCGVYFEVIVDDEDVCDEDYNGPLDDFEKGYIACLDEKYIFNFDVALFKSYERRVDTSD